MHLADSSKSPHLPPYWASTSTVLERVFVPCPQVALQSPHFDQSLNLQSFGHFVPSQGAVSSPHGHFPSSAAGLITVRDRLLVPSPQSALQAVQSDHELIVQSAVHS